jgi:transcriptional regulator with XRE-family HTH domain
LLTPDQIRSLRERLGLTQREVSELLQIGEKTWTRWETGRDRPSRSINVLLCALNDGRIDVAYLRSLARRRNDWAARLATLAESPKNPWMHTVQVLWQNWEPGAMEEFTEAVRKHLEAMLAAVQPQSQFGFEIQTPEIRLPDPAAFNAIQVHPAPTTAAAASNEELALAA